MKRLILPLALAALIVMLAAACGGGTADRSSQIAAEIGPAAECSATDYEITSKLDHSKTRIYDCLANGKEMCVTEENGLAHDSTAIVKLLFADTISGGKPSCLTG